MRGLRHLPAIALALPLMACSTARVDERLAYWRAETAAHLPAGTSKPEAEAFFAARGVPLNCCVSEKRDQWLHVARERDVGYQLWTHYDVVVLVEFSAAQTVAGVTVQRWGVGL